MLAYVEVGTRTAVEQVDAIAINAFVAQRKALRILLALNRYGIFSELHRCLPARSCELRREQGRFRA